ncbi:MAG TPA: hypothetical protein DCR93_13290 [Cytophagales bacterium]|nr:hypothetical protein [Cytophagales bacterium]HAP60416.1 hypothetical protein [Cytophagales bacterium]
MLPFDGYIYVVISAHVTVVSILAFLCFQVKNIISIKEFYFIGVTWLVNLLYLVLNIPSEISEPSTLNPWILTELNIDTTYLFAVINILSNYAALQLTPQKTKERISSLTRIRFNYVVVFVLLLSEAVGIVIPEFTSLNQSVIIWHALPKAIINTLSLLAIYKFLTGIKYLRFLKIGRIKYRPILLGLGGYAIMQPLTLFNLKNIAEIEYFSVLITISAVFKILVLYGVHLLFLEWTKTKTETETKRNIKSENEHNINVQLNNIIGRLFHEINQPLIYINQKIELLTEKDRETIRYNKKVASLIQELENTFNIVLATISASADTYRISGKLGIAQGNPFDEKFDFKLPENDSLKKRLFQSVNTPIQSAVLNFKTYILENEFDIKYEMTFDYGGNVDTKLNSYEITRVFINLLKNSLEAAVSNKQKELNIYIKSHNKKTDTKKEIHIILEDNGPGIATEILDKVWNNRFTTKNGDNRGFGLTIAKEIIDSHGGSIKLSTETRFNSGVKFTIILPKIED